MSRDAGREIRLVESDGRWTAADEITGVTAEGESRGEALANLDEVVALHEGDIADPVDEDALLAEVAGDCRA